MNVDDARIRHLEINNELSRRRVVELAREDINVFAEYVFYPHLQHDYHRELQELFNSYNRICVDAPVEHGKTTQAGIIRILWKIGRNPSEMIALIGNAPRRPRECLATVKAVIETNERYQEVFPHVKLVKATRDELVVQRSVSSDAGPTLLAIGVGGSIIGSRFTGIVLDDVQDFYNTYSENERRKLRTIIESTVLNRLAQNGWLIDIGTPWTWDDMRHWLRRLPGYEFRHFDAETGEMSKLVNGRLRVIKTFKGGLWPEQWTNPLTGTKWGWPRWRLEEKKGEISRMEWMRQYRCKPLAGVVQIFKIEDIERCVLELGELGRPKDDASVIVTGVDLAIDKKSIADETVFFTIHPHDGKKELLDITRGHWEIDGILQQMVRLVRKYPSHRGFRVESNQAQAYIKQATDKPEIMKALGADNIDLARLYTTAHYTGRKKLDPDVGIRSMAIDFEQHRWMIPKGQADAEDWIQALVNFDPIAHCSDLVMASWLASEEARRYGTGGKTTWERVGVY